MGAASGEWGLPGCEGHCWECSCLLSNPASAWKGSPGHNAVILELGGWSGSNWPAMGTGIYENYAVLWFGDGTDPQGSVGTCLP